jgi:hypothetical protein
MTPRPLPWLAGAAALLLLFTTLCGSMWSDSVDLAHHYSLVARLAEHWRLQAAYDHSLGEMNVYPRLSHALAAALARLNGSPLLGLQWTAVASWITAWAVLVAMLRQLPARAAALGAAVLAALLLLNYFGPRLELHGSELVVNFFFSQIVGQAFALALLLLALHMERVGVAPLWRYALLLAGIRLCCGIHLMPATELLAVLALQAALDLAAWPRRRQGLAASLPALAIVLAPIAGALLLYTHPGFAVMKSISANSGGIHTVFLTTLPGFGAYAALLLLLSAALLQCWRRLAAAAPAQAGQALGLKYLALYGLACAGSCLLQLALLHWDMGSEYAVKKYLFALHSAMLLQLSLLPVVLLGWHRDLPHVGRERNWQLAGGAAGLLLLAMATAGTQRPKVLDTRAMMRIERQLTLLRDQHLAAQPGRYDYVSQLPGLSPNGAYMYSIGLLHTPRTDDLRDVMNGRAPRALQMIGNLLTGPAGEYSQYQACRAPGSSATLLILDGACLQRLAPHDHPQTRLSAPPPAAAGAADLT